MGLSAAELKILGFELAIGAGGVTGTWSDVGLGLPYPVLSRSGAGLEFRELELLVDTEAITGI